MVFICPFTPFLRRSLEKVTGIVQEFLVGCRTIEVPIGRMRLEDVNVVTK